MLFEKKIRRNERLIPDTTGINLKNIIKVEEAKIKTTYGVTPYRGNVQKRQIQEDRQLIGICLEPEVRMGVKSK